MNQAELIQLGLSLVAVLFVAWLVGKLGLGADPRIEDAAHGIRGQVRPAAAEVREDSAALGGAPGAAAHPGAEAAVAASARVIICNGDTLRLM